MTKSGTENDVNDQSGARIGQPDHVNRFLKEEYFERGRND